MNRRNLLLITAAMPLMLLGSAQQNRAGIPEVSGQQPEPAYMVQRRAAIQMNDLAGQIQSLDDSRRLVDMLAAMFADELPPKWVTREIRDRIARAEYESATDPAELIPEQRIADAWNKYVQEIGAPQEALINVAEIHNLRDSYYATANFLWNRGSQSIWTMPNIYALGPDEKVAEGCRALDAMRVVEDIATRFENLRSARALVQKGIVFSDSMKQQKQASAHGEARSFAVGRMEVLDNPVEAAEIRYVHEHGEVGLGRAIEGLIDDLFPTKG